ncbi:HAD domain-containing protein [Limnoglobus roseus]|uniref:Uncharacterized protein n=1 Tax=Limnoglobus roseus TaxID=2598579 RepID=A0A5C1AJ99_9BACT|nr:HAD domain-containing protein [Limnoglobus roseus]QEL19261.1 hypothetical protein PX52LOC_06323 [Limnoglobus roseus]
MTNERGRQIADWLAANKHPVRYAVVDDLDLGITAAGHPLVQTDGHVGLTDADAEELVSVLSPDVVTKESCCDCGEDYPRHERLRGEIFCFTCRRK